MARRLLLLAAAAAAAIGGCEARIKDPDYDCQLRGVARDYTEEVVLGPWQSPRRAEAALGLVVQGLRLLECGNASRSGGPAAPPKRAASGGGAPGGGAAAAVQLHVSPGGDDSATGSEASPLRTVAGAQARIRAKYPTVAARPAIRVLFAPGDYAFGAAPTGHVLNATRYSGTSIARFDSRDSGASAASPVTYAAASPASPVPARFVGGVPLANLTWAPATALGLKGVYMTTLPGHVEIDVQDQLFLGGAPLVRGRTPNGKPWIPQDGYNLTVYKTTGMQTMAPVYTQCADGGGAKPKPCSSLPRPPAPAAGQCVAAGNVSLLCGYPAIPGVLLSPTKAASATECAALCAKNTCCKGYTWHDQSTGSYWKDCFLLTSPSADAWTTAQPMAGHHSGLCGPSAPAASCLPPASHNCRDATVVCAATNVTQVTGSLGIASAAGAKLAGPTGVVKVTECLAHLLDLANDWPHWNAASYGLSQDCASASDPQCVRTMYTKYNYPLWYGPWASGIEIDLTQDAGVDMSQYTWADADQVVVHAMADGEWGGTQFQVASQSKSADGNPVLAFAYGGFQQARGATLGGTDGEKRGNRFYMEGSIDFLDSPGEWCVQQIDAPG